MQTLNAVLCTLALLTCVACVAVLFRAYAASGVRLLFWSALCFVFLAVNNLLLFFDVVVYQGENDLRMWRFTSALLGIAALVVGFVREPE